MKRMQEVAINLVMPGLKHVETARLIVRRLMPTDAPAYHALMTCLRSDTRVQRFLGLGELLAVDKYAEVIKTPRNRCHFGILRKESEIFIGVAGFLLRQPFVAPEMYVWLVPDFWGQGFGPEAGNALINAAFQKRYCDAVIGVPHPDNVRSIKLLAKMDMRQCASIVDLVEADPGIHEFGREHRFPIFCRCKSES